MSPHKNTKFKILVLHDNWSLHACNNYLWWWSNIILAIGKTVNIMTFAVQQQSKCKNHNKHFFIKINNFTIKNKLSSGRSSRLLSLLRMFSLFIDKFNLCSMIWLLAISQITYGAKINHLLTALISFRPKLLSFFFC